MLNKKLWVQFLREMICQTKNRKAQRAESEGNVPLTVIMLVVSSVLFSRASCTPPLVP